VRRGSSLSVIGAALLAVVGCTAEHLVSGFEPPIVRSIEPSRVHGPWVPAGEAFTARTDRALDSATSVPGTPFEATVETAVRDPSGAVVVPAGATVRGHVVDVRANGPLPGIVVDFDAIDTVRGVAALHAVLRSTGAEALVPGRIANAAPNIDEVLRAPTYGSPHGGPAIGGGPRSDTLTPVTPRVHLPAGAPMRLVLVEPLIPPGTTVAPK
jgi:hypothetical protein